MDVVGRRLYRALLRSGAKFDAAPALKALIVRGTLGVQLPAPLDAHVAAFLGGAGRQFYWPSPAAGLDGARSVAEAVRQGFRFPPDAAEAASLEGGFQALRYLSALLAAGERHGVAAAAAALRARLEAEEAGRHAAAWAGGGAGLERGGAGAGGGAGDAGGRARVVPAPGKGAVLLAHPLVPGFFGGAVVLVCDLDPERGAYGLVLNKAFGGSARALVDQLSSARGGAGGAPAAARQSSSAAAAGEGGVTAAEAEAAARAAAAAAGAAAPGAAAAAAVAALGRLVGRPGGGAAAAPGPRGAGGAVHLQGGEVVRALAEALRELHDASDGDGPETESEEEEEVAEAEALAGEWDEYGGAGGPRAGAGDEDDDGDASGDEAGWSTSDGEEEEEALDLLSALGARPGGPLGALAGLAGGAGGAASFRVDVGADGSVLVAPLGGGAGPGGGGAAGGAAAARQPARSLITAAAADEGAAAAGGGDLVAAGSGGGGTLVGGGRGPGGDAGGGAAGVVATVAQVMAVFERSPLLRGGPIPGMQILHRAPGLGGEPVVVAGEGAAEGAAGLRVGAELSRAPALVGSGALRPERDVAVFVGDSGWAAGQLEDEVGGGTWAVARAPLPALEALLFGGGGGGGGEGGDAGEGGAAAASGRAAWQRMLCALGPQYWALAAVPPGCWEDVAAIKI